MIKAVKIGIISLSFFVGYSVNASINKINGESVYESKCALCHEKGASGSPKLGDKSNWQPRLEKGIDKLFKKVTNREHHVSCYKCSDSEIKEAIKYMATQSGGGNRTLW